MCCKDERYGYLNMLDITSTLTLRQMTFDEVKNLIEKNLEDSSQYVEKYRQKKYNHYLSTVHEDEEGVKHAMTYEDWKKTYNAKKIIFDQYLPSSTFQDLSENYFYSKKCQFANIQSNFLQKFYFDQFGKEYKDPTIFDHNIILLNLLSFCKGSHAEKVAHFGELLSRLTFSTNLTIENFVLFVRIYIETNTLEVFNRLMKLNSDHDDNSHSYEVFLKEHEREFKGLIDDVVNEIGALYKLKDKSEEKVYLVEKADFPFIFNNREYLFNFEDLWKYFLEKQDLVRRHMI